MEMFVAVILQDTVGRSMGRDVETVHTQAESRSDEEARRE